MDMLDYRFAVMMNEERARNWRRERGLRTPVGPGRSLPEPRREGRSGWRVAAFLGRLLPDHGKA